MKTKTQPKLRNGKIATPLDLKTPMLIDDIFMSLAFAKKEFSKRKEDVSLKKSTNQILTQLPENLRYEFSQPRAVIFRQIGTPSYEFLRFLKLANKVDLKPLVIEYHGDKFVSAHNQYKRSLGKLPIYQYTGGDGRRMYEYKTILDFNSYTGKPMSDITCFDGTSLSDKHHHLLLKTTGINPLEYCVDTTPFFNSFGKNASEYYSSFLSLFIQSGIYFENYFDSNDERTFVQNTVMPAFEKNIVRYGVPPIIVRILPKENETSLHWDSYPPEIQKYL